MNRRRQRRKTVTVKIMSRQKEWGNKEWGNTKQAERTIEYVLQQTCDGVTGEVSSPRDVGVVELHPAAQQDESFQLILGHHL